MFVRESSPESFEKGNKNTTSFVVKGGSKRGHNHEKQKMLHANRNVQAREKRARGTARRYRERREKVGEGISRTWRGEFVQIVGRRRPIGGGVQVRESSASRENVFMSSLPKKTKKKKRALYCSGNTEFQCVLHENHSQPVRSRSLP